MPSIDFDAALAAEERAPVTFTIYGQTFQCVPVDELPWTAGLRLADAPEEGAAAEAAIVKWFDTVLISQDRDRFRLVLEALGAPALKRLMEWLAQVYSGRPFEEPATSPAGSSPTGPSAKVVRLWEPNQAASTG